MGKFSFKLVIGNRENEREQIRQCDFPCVGAAEWEWWRLRGHVLGKNNKNNNNQTSKACVCCFHGHLLYIIGSLHLLCFSFQDNKGIFQTFLTFQISGTTCYQFKQRWAGPGLLVYTNLTHKALTMNQKCKSLIYQGRCKWNEIENQTLVQGIGSQTEDCWWVRMGASWNGNFLLRFLYLF